MGLASKVNASGGGGAGAPLGVRPPPSAPPQPGAQPYPGQGSSSAQQHIPPSPSNSFTSSYAAPPRPSSTVTAAAEAATLAPQQQAQAQVGWPQQTQSARQPSAAGQYQAQTGYPTISYSQPSSPFSGTSTNGLAAQPNYLAGQTSAPSGQHGLAPQPHTTYYQQQPYGYQYSASHVQQQQQQQQPMVSGSGYGAAMFPGGPGPASQGYPGAAPGGVQGAPRPGGYPPVGGAPASQGYPAPHGGQPGFPPAGQQPGGFGQQPGFGQQAPRPGYPPVSGAPPPHGQQFGAPLQAQPYGAPQQQPYGGQAYGMPPTPHGGANASYAGVSGLMGAPGSAGSVTPVVQQKLRNMVRTNRLEAFYPEQALNRVFSRLDCVNFAALSQKWSMPLELATDLAQLALYDIVLFCDDSGSMVFEERGERVDDLKLIMGRVAEVATLFDDDGILVRFMNNNTEGNGIRDANSATSLVQQVQFNGMTPLGTNLENKVIRPFLLQGIQKRDLQKPILVIVISDGEPVGEPPGTVKRVIQQAKGAAANSPYGPGAISFEFAQVGKDQKAQRFLGELDNDPEIGNVVDATSYYELEAEEYARKGVTLTPELWLVKLMVGAIDPSYDEQD